MTLAPKRRPRRPALCLTCAFLLAHAAFALPAAARTFQTELRAAGANLTSPDPAVRAQAACDIREHGSEAASLIPALVTLLGDGSPVDRGVCGERTWRFGHFEDLTTPGEQAVSALVAIGERSFDPLLGALKSPVWIARRNAAWGLGALRDERAVEPLLRTLADENGAVRAEAAWALGAMGDERAITPLTRRLKDDDPHVRRQAAWALGVVTR
jgi:HEAT repeat protein